MFTSARGLCVMGNNKNKLAQAVRQLAAESSVTLADMGQGQIFTSACTVWLHVSACALIPLIINFRIRFYFHDIYTDIDFRLIIILHDLWLLIIYKDIIIVQIIWHILVACPILRTLNSKLKVKHTEYVNYVWLLWRIWETINIC